MRIFPFALWFVLTCAAVLDENAVGDSSTVSQAESGAAPAAERPSSVSEEKLAAARGARQAGDPARARALVAEAIGAALANVSESVDARVLEHWMDLGDFAHTAGDLASARRVREELVAVLTRKLPDDHPDLQRARLSLANTLYALGDLQGARALQEHVLVVSTRTLPDDHSDLQRARGNLALTIRELGDLQGARALQEQVLAVSTRTLPDDHPDLQRARGNLALTIRDLGDPQGARALQEQVLAVSTRTLPDDHPSLQRARVNLAATIYSLGDGQGARALLEQVLAVLTRTLPDEHPDLQKARLNLAGTIYSLGDLQGARALYVKVLEVLSRTLPDEHPDLQIARLGLAATMHTLGDLAGARALEEKVLEVRLRTLPDDHPDIQAARLNLAITIRTLGDLAGARTLQEKVLEVRSRTLPDDHPDLQWARGSLADTIKSLGDLAGARALEEKELEVRSRTLPDDHPDLQAARGRLAGTIKALGDLAGARALEEEVLEVRSRTLPDDHPDLQAARGNLAGTIKALGDLAGARALEEKVFEVRSRTLPDDHPDLQWARGNLAGTIMALGDLAGARALEEKVLEVRSRTLPDDHPDLQAARGNLAGTIYSLGDLHGARALYLKVLEVYSRTLPDDHPELQRVRENLSWTLGLAAATSAATGAGSQLPQREIETCTQLLLSATAGRCSAFLHALTSVSPRETEEAAQSGLRTLDQTLSFALGYGSIGPLRALEPAAFTLSETTRGAAVRAAAWQRRAAGSKEYEELSARARAATDELARLAQSGGEREAFHAARAASEEVRQQLAALAREISGGADPTQRVAAEAVAAALAAEDAVVAYRRFVRSSVQAAANEGDGQAVLQIADGASPPPGARFTRERTESLCAFVVRPAQGGGAPALTLVDLGPLEPIEAAVEAWRDALGASSGRGLAVANGDESGPESGHAAAAGRALRQLLFDPLARALGDARRIVVLHDDVTNLVPLDTLPDATQGLVGDRMRVEVRSTLVELLDPRERNESDGIVLALGEARFDARPLEYSAAQEDDAAKQDSTASHDGVAKQDDAADPDAAPASEPHVAHLAGLVRGTAWEQGFTPLAHTGPEARGVAELWTRGVGAADGAIVLTGAQASRSSLTQLAPRARWLHVATHGWHAPESVKSFEDVAREQSEDMGALRASTGDVVKGMSPMLLCGLALAGANLPEDAVGRAPGLLTAEEMSALDLSNCELAVLSACDTNVGQRKAGQGVASFQRALQMAGARSVITSLWKVPDEATRELMLDFYRRVWVLKQPKGQALWGAKMALRDTKDEHGNPRYTTRDWAAWVLTGEPD